MKKFLAVIIVALALFIISEARGGELIPECGVEPWEVMHSNAHELWVKAFFVNEFPLVYNEDEDVIYNQLFQQIDEYVADLAQYKNTDGGMKFNYVHFKQIFVDRKNQEVYLRFNVFSLKDRKDMFCVEDYKTNFNFGMNKLFYAIREEIWNCVDYYLYNFEDMKFRAIYYSCEDKEEFEKKKEKKLDI